MADLLDRVRTHVDVLAELIGERSDRRPAALEAARAFITRELEAMGHTVVRYEYSTLSRPAVNLEVLLEGRSPDRPTLVVGAHYDTVWGTPGADDNASAVAALLEIARDFAGKRPSRPVRLVFYDCEEPPHFGSEDMGSAHHARQCRERGERLLGMICLESLGYYAREIDERIPRPMYLRVLNGIFGNRNIIIVSDLGSIGFGLRFLARFVAAGLFPFLPAALPQAFGAISLSDHRCYWAYGYRALMVTDTAFLRNPNYHTPNDRLVTLDLPRLARLTRQLSRAIRRLAG